MKKDNEPRFDIASITALVSALIIIGLIILFIIVNK